MGEDVCAKLVRYARSCIVANEPQALALFLSAITGYAPTVREYSPVCVFGELSSGKTHLIRVIVGDERTRGIEAEFSGLFPSENVFHFTSASDKAPIYLKELRDMQNPIKMVVAAEYKKLNEPVVEYFKSMSGDDPVFKYCVTNMAKGDADAIMQKKRWFCITYAQHDLDPELESRLLTMSVEENRWVTSCVIELNHGATDVFYPVTERTYRMCPDEELASEIRTEIGLLALDPIEVINPFSRALRNFEDNSRASSKRVSRMTEALFRASARVNHDNRIEHDGKVVMSQQDIVNVLSFSEIVQSMVLGIDRIDLAIIRYLGTVRHRVKEEEIISRIDDSGLAELKRDELTDRLRKLENNNFVIRKEPLASDDEKIRKWIYNNRKYIHRVRVDWDEIAAVEGMVELIDPITGQMYSNIIEYGKEFDRENSKGLEFQQVASADEEDSLDNKVRTAVVKMLSSATVYNDVGKLINDIRVNLKLVSLDSFGFDADVNRIVEQMVKEKAIALNELSGRLTLLDESVRRTVVPA